MDIYKYNKYKNKYKNYKYQLGGGRRGDFAHAKVKNAALVLQGQDTELNESFEEKKRRYTQKLIYQESKPIKDPILRSHPDDIFIDSEIIRIKLLIDYIEGIKILNDQLAGIEHNTEKDNINYLIEYYNLSIKGYEFMYNLQVLIDLNNNDPIIETRKTKYINDIQGIIEKLKSYKTSYTDTITISNFYETLYRTYKQSISGLLNTTLLIRKGENELSQKLIENEEILKTLKKTNDEHEIILKKLKGTNDEKLNGVQATRLERFLYDIQQLNKNLVNDIKKTQQIEKVASITDLNSLSTLISSNIEVPEHIEIFKTIISNIDSLQFQLTEITTK